LDGDEHKRTDAPRASTPPRQEAPATRPWQRWAGRWAFAAIPAVGLVELGAHAVQTHSVAPDRDWRSARDYVAAQIKPDDLVAFAPRWVDPIGRMQLGSGIATLEREARPDESRFPRAFEVSLRGAHDPSLEGWRRTGEERFGDVTVRTLENPAPAQVLDDLVSMVGSARMQVSRVEGDRAIDCPFTHAGPQSGGLGAGPALPADRFVCPSGGFVAASVAADLEYHPRRCIYAPPQGGRGALRIRFLGVRLGHTLHGHHALYVEAERDRRGTPVTITFRVGDTVVGSVVHHDGDGWKPFEFDTTELAAAASKPGALEGPRADIVADIETANGERRMYCFEADTR
jgi:hypothetical protein